MSEQWTMSGTISRENDGDGYTDTYDLTFTKVPPPTPAATGLTLAISERKKPMPVAFTVDTTDGVATLQFVDRVGDKVAGPNDSVTGAPVVPTVVSDNTACIPAPTLTATANPGEFSGPIAQAAAEGVVNLSVAPLTNSDGSAVNETEGPNAGQPFDVSAATAQITVAAGAAGTLEMSVTG